MDAKEIRELAKGTIFSVVFTKKKDGTTRKMLARLGVKKHLKGGTKPFNDDDYNLLTVYDLQKKAYRSINMSTLKKLKIRGKEINL